MKTPTCKKELSQFVGLANYFGRYIRNFAELIEPLNALRKEKVGFAWGPNQQKAFEDLKNVLAVYPVVQAFDPAKDTVLTTDASEKSISAIMTQDGHPIMYLSRKLSNSETNYSNIEREALAVVWATTRARHFLMDKKFTLCCDHKPLEFIFHPNREIPKITTARLARWTILLAAFDYEIMYVKGDSIPHVDALSRLNFVEGDELNIEYEDGHELGESVVQWTETDVLSLERLRWATSNDSILAKIMIRIRLNTWNNCSPCERPFKCVRDTLSVDNGIICKGDLVVPPAVLRKDVLKAVHGENHCGMITMRNRLKLEAWWPGYCDNVESYVRLCSRSAELRSNGQKYTHTWPEEDRPWARVHMDHGYVPGVGMMLILVDAYSSWTEDKANVTRVVNTSKYFPLPCKVACFET